MLLRTKIVLLQNIFSFAEAFSLLYMKELIIIILLLASTATFGQTTTLLEEIDRQVGLLIEENDVHKYSYDLEIFKQRAEKVFEGMDEDSVANFQFKHFQTIHINPMVSAGVRDSALVLYYFKTIQNDHYFNWICLGEATFETADIKMFTDQFQSESNNFQVSQLNYHHLSGLAITDEFDAQVYYVPDIRLRLNFEIISDIRVDSEKKDVALRVIDDRLTTLLRNVDVMNLDLRGLPRLMVIESPNKELRIATYMVVYDDFDSRCFGVVIHHSDKGVQITRLQDESANMRVPEKAHTNPKNWYGAIYTSMVEAKFGKQVYYTLLGFKSNDGLVKTRVLETLTFVNEKCVFGSPLFIHERGAYGRRVFRYSAGANMMIRFDETAQMLVFDHLSPSNSMFKGEYRFYGPDFSYDAYELTKKGWVFREDVDLRNP